MTYEQAKTIIDKYLDTYSIEEHRSTLDNKLVYEIYTNATWFTYYTSGKCVYALEMEHAYTNATAFENWIRKHF